MEEKQKCSTPNCGKEAVVSFHFCKGCYEAIEKIKQETQKNLEKSGGKKWF